MQNDKVFAVVNNSPFAFLGYRFLLDNGVPMVGGGYDGNEYGQPGNEKLISILGNISPVYGAQYTRRLRRAHEEGGREERRRGVVRRLGVVDRGGEEPAEVRGARRRGSTPAYTNTTVDFGTTDVGPLVLGMKNAGVDATYLPLVLSTNLAIIQTAAQNNLKFKLAVLATGYGQSLLDQPARRRSVPRCSSPRAGRRWS